jgi:GDP-4-dehydro-6-deoxy-D-mannose reductase
MMNVLITGAAGFTARHLTQRLRAMGSVQITGTDLAAAKPEGVWLQDYIAGDLSDLTRLRETIRRSRPQWIFHLAGLFRGGVYDIYRANLTGGLNLLEAVRMEAPEAAVLVVGSAAEYGVWPPAEMPLSERHPCQPAGAYGSSKYALTLAAQAYHRENGLKVLVARPFNLLGAGMPATLVVGAIAHRAKAALEAGQSRISVGNLASQRDFVAIEDAVDAYVRLLEAGAWGEIFNIASGEGCSIDYVVKSLLSFAPTPIELVQDEELKRWNDPPIVTGDPAKIHSVCGASRRVPLQETLRAVWESVMTPARLS